MPDPTFGAVTVTLLVAAGKLLAEGTVKEFAKGIGGKAFEALKARLTRDNGVNTIDLIDRIEETPALAETVEKDIDASPAPDDLETLALVEQLRAALDALPREQIPAYAIEGGTFDAGRDLIARRVEGLRNVQMKAERDIDLSGARSPGSRSPGKD